MTKNKYVWHILLRLVRGKRAPVDKYEFGDDNNTEWYEDAVMEILMR